jgi:hypothetical protein
MSNILKVVMPENGGASRPTDDCLPCLVTSVLVMVGGGLYLATGLVFRPRAGEVMPKMSPLWRNFVRGSGVGVTMYGGYRARDAYELWQKERRATGPR